MVRDSKLKTTTYKTLNKTDIELLAEVLFYLHNQSNSV